MKKSFDVVVVGGTFDEFHKGHQALLMKAFEISNRVLVGLSSDDFARELRKPHEVDAYNDRLEDLKDFLEKQKVMSRAKIIPLHDSYGVTLSRGCAEAIVVSRETEPVAYEINEKRGKMGLPHLIVISIELIPAENHSSISTTRIRQGEIDREGKMLSSSHKRRHPPH